MATTYKSFLNNDIVSSRTLLHEAIPLTGTLISGTYNGAAGAEENIKTYSHGKFESIFDYPYLSSSANHIVDITAGFASTSALSQSSSTTGSVSGQGYYSVASQKAKISNYNQMAQILMGYDATGSIQVFDEDGDLLAGGAKMKECFFVNFSRLLTKDEIKKGTFKLELGVGTQDTPTATRMNSRIKLYDKNGSTSFKTNSPAGEFGILYADSTDGSDRLATDTGTVKAGLIYYQAGVAVVTASVFHDTAVGEEGGDTGEAAGRRPGGKRGGGILSTDTNDVMFSSNAANALQAFSSSLSGSSLDKVVNDVRSTIYDISFNNTTELNSTIYFCRANHNEFNYSTNPTYVSNSKIVVKDSTLDTPVSYITTIGLYSADNELLAVAKLSEPIKKDPQTELTFRVRLDY